MNFKKRKGFFYILRIIILLSFLCSNILFANDLSTDSDTLAPSTNFPMLYNDAAVDLIALDVIRTLSEKGDASAKVFYKKYIEEEVAQEGRDVKCFGVREIEGRDGRWAFYIVDLKNNKITRFTPAGDVTDRFFYVLNEIKKFIAVETDVYKLAGREYKKETYKIPPEAINFVRKCLSRIYVYPDLETKILSMYPDEISWVKEHAIRTAKIAEIIASRMQLGDVLVRYIRLAALAHDLGKGCSREMIDAINSPARGKANIINIHAEESFRILKDAGIVVDRVVEAGIRYHHAPWAVEERIARLVTEIVYIADQIDASQDTHRPYKSMMRDIRLVLRELRGEYKGTGQASRLVYKAFYLALADAQRDLMNVIYEARGDVRWDVTDGNGQKHLFTITFDADGKNVQTKRSDVDSGGDLYNQGYVEDALGKLVGRYGTGILSGLKQVDIVDRNGPVGSRVNEKAEIDIDVFRDKNMVLEALEYEAIHEILGIIIPDNTYLSELVATWYSLKRFIGLSKAEQDNIIKILEDKSNRMDSAGKYAEMLRYINANKLTDDNLIKLAIAYLGYRELSVAQVKAAEDSFGVFVTLLNDLSEANIQDMKRKVYDTEKKMIKVIKTLSGVRVEGRVPGNIRKVIGYIVRNEDWALPKSNEQSKTRYIVVNRERIADKLDKDEFKAVMSELQRANIQIVYDINDILKDKEVNLLKDVVVLVDPEDVKDWEGENRLCYLPLPYMDFSLRLAGYMVLSGDDIRPGTPVYNFVKGFYEKLLGKDLSSAFVTNLFIKPWYALPKTKKFNEELSILREAITQLSVSA